MKNVKFGEVDSHRWRCIGSRQITACSHVSATQNNSSFLFPDFWTSPLARQNPSDASDPSVCKVTSLLAPSRTSAVKPEVNKPEIDKPQADTREVKKQEVNKPEVKKPEVNKQDARKPEVNKTNGRSSSGYFIQEVKSVAQPGGKGITNHPLNSSPPGGQNQQQEIVFSSTKIPCADTLAPITPVAIRKSYPASSTQVACGVTTLKEQRDGNTTSAICVSSPHSPEVVVDSGIASGAHASPTRDFSVTATQPISFNGRRAR